MSRPLGCEVDRKATSSHSAHVCDGPQVDADLVQVQSFRGKVHFASSRVEVAHDPALAGVEDLVAAVDKAGYKSRPAAF